MQSAAEYRDISGGMETAEMANTAPITSSSSAGPSTTSEGPDGFSRAGAAPLIAHLADWFQDQGWVCRACNHVFGEIAVHDLQEEVLKSP